jgi:hypothetical protein
VPTAPPAYDISMTYDALGKITSKICMNSYLMKCQARCVDMGHGFGGYMVSWAIARFAHDTMALIESILLACGTSYHCW